jgi:hypothetical protein
VTMSDLRSRLPVNAPMMLVAVIAAAGLVRVLTQHWREGAALIAGAMLAAAVLRVLLPTDRVGLLAIRSKVVDVFCYLAFGVVMLGLALTITHSVFAVR